MTDELGNLEKELRALEPRGLSKAGRRKLDAALFRPASRIRVLQIAVPVAVAASLLLAVGVTMLLHGGASLPAPASTQVAEVDIHALDGNCFEPVSVDTMLAEQRDEGMVERDGDVPVRRIRRRFVDRSEWYDARHGRTLTLTRPREEVIFVSLDMQ
jgi:hypothetical protein